MLKNRYQEDDKVEAGVDEVGRGCLWGPLVAAAVIWPEESEWTDEIRTLSAQIKDSKKLSEKKRTALATQIKKYAKSYAVGKVEAEEIDALGMTSSNQTAFTRAITGLTLKPTRLLVDGIIPIPNWQEEQHTIVEGDGKYICIAAASIVGKDYRDTFVKAWAESNVKEAALYALSSNKGYGTAAHRKGLQEHGPLAQHRRLFLRKILGVHIYDGKRQGQVQIEKKQNQCQIQNDSDIEE